MVLEKENGLKDYNKEEGKGREESKGRRKRKRKERWDTGDE